jgi:hypothetical protein
MNVLRDLEARLKSQPDQQRLGRQRELFRNTKAQAEDRRAAIRTVLREVRALRTIGGNPRLLAEEEATLVAAVRSRGSELASLLGKPSPSTSTIGAQLDAIRRGTVALATPVAAAWESVRRQYLDRAAALTPLAEKVSPNTLTALQALTQLLRAHATPPASSSGVQSLLAAIATFNAAIQHMNIDGAVGQFLRDASTTGADPRALFQPEVKTYLDEHPQLWTALRVGLK